MGCLGSFLTRSGGMCTVVLLIFHCWDPGLVFWWREKTEVRERTRVKEKRGLQHIRQSKQLSEGEQNVLHVDLRVENHEHNLWGCWPRKCKYMQVQRFFLTLESTIWLNYLAHVSHAPGSHSTTSEYIGPKIVHALSVQHNTYSEPSTCTDITSC